MVFKEAIKNLSDGEEYTALSLDIDDLKSINDQCGFIAGDKVICDVANVLKEETRNADIVCRMGGDEFVVLLRGMNDPAIALAKTRKICKRLKSIPLQGKEATLSCPAGITLANQRENFIDVAKRTDKALSEAKKENEDCYLI